MISHKHKVIFIHIAKCAGSSVERAFGIDFSKNGADYNMLYGWDNQNKLYLQHATPQELLDYNLISKEIWDTYYKFVIVRNSWDKSLSDYQWMMRELNVKDSFKNYINKSGKFKKALNHKNNIGYRGDHLTKQIDYFYLNGKLIEYDRILYFDNLKEDFLLLTEYLNLSPDFFMKKINDGIKKHHYSVFYSNKMKKLVDKKYKKDIVFFNFNFLDKRTTFDNYFFNKISEKIQIVKSWIGKKLKMLKLYK